jgi:putative Mn2+ efflux pump MntP
MLFFDLFMIAVGLSMDAFAVSICKGLATKRIEPKYYLSVGLWFGGFQAGMPLLGYFLGSAFEEKISRYDHWVAFILLGLIGINMIREAFSKEEDEENASFSARTMLPMAVATSIDALTVGIMFGITPGVNIRTRISLIGITTFCFSARGLKIGHVFGLKYKSKAEILGGLILISMGIRILLEHLGIIG